MAILKLLYNEEYWDDIENIGSSRFMSLPISPKAVLKKRKDEFIIVKPNPANTYIEIDFGLPVHSNTPVKIEIHKATGEKIYDKDIQTGNPRLRINTETFAEGFYFVRVYNYTSSFNTKFLIIR